MGAFLSTKKSMATKSNPITVSVQEYVADDSTMDSPFTIAIVGSGIGGLALAIGLEKQNVRYVILESAARFDAVGAGIGLGPNSLRAMELMDPKFAAMFDAVKVNNTSPSRVHEQFEVLGGEEGFGMLREPKWTGGHVGHENFTRSSAHRKDLLDIMQSLVPESTVRFNKRVVKIRQEEGQRVKIDCTDGELIEVDAVIGCDGIKGMSRKEVLGSRWPEEVPAKYAHTYIYRGIASMVEAKKIMGSYAEDAKWFMSEGRGCAMYPISKGKEVNMVAFIEDKKDWEGPQVTREVSKAEMDEEFQDFDIRLKTLLENVSSALRRHFRD